MSFVLPVEGQTARSHLNPEAIFLLGVWTIAFVL